MLSRCAVFGLALLLAGVGCRNQVPSGTAPLFDGIGSHHREITTTSSDAQRYFDQGLVFTFAFNHDEAIRSFQQAATIDPGCAMAYWGIALANGPHINNPAMDAEHSKAAWEALAAARARAVKATPLERALIDALGARYAEVPPESRAGLDRAYADAMGALWQSNPKDADIGVLFAESMMDLRPWDLWQPDGRPQPGTEEVVSALEAAIKLDVKHPGAHHLYIHTVEASQRPERGVPSADRLRDLVPVAGHLVHMPAHIYCRVGRWADASAANQRAIESDRAYRAISPEQGFYRIYMAHNHHFLSWASMMEGRSAAAIEAARAMIAGIPPEFVKEAAFFADGFMTIELDALKRFGRWEELLAKPAPPEYLPITTAFWHYTRGLAFSATGRIEEAKGERALFETATLEVGPDRIIGNNTALQVLEIARKFLDGEIAYREGRMDEAIAALREAEAAEDALRYDEAPDWIQPVRHALGGVLFLAGRVEEAEKVYRADLVKFPENGWSLFGLAKCLRARKADAASSRDANREAAEVEARFAKAWARADIKLESTCLCLPALTGF